MSFPAEAQREQALVRSRGMITVNCLRVTPPKRGIYYHYDVAFSETVSTRAKSQLIDTLLRTYRGDFPSGCAFDGERNLFSPEDLRGGPTFPVTVGRTDINITLTLAGVIKPGSFDAFMGSTSNDINVWIASEGQRLPAIMLLNVLVRVGPMRGRNWVSNGRALYSGDRFFAIKDAPLELWKGYFQSVRHTIRGLTLNLDNTMTVMYRRGNVLDALIDQFQAHERGTWDPARFRSEYERHSGWQKIENRARRFLKGVRVVRNYQQEKYKNKPSLTVQDIIPQSADAYRFEMNDGSELSVTEYFEQILRERLRYPRFPLLVKYKKAAIPLEKLDIVAGQIYKGPVPELAKAQWVREATMNPDQRFKALEDARRTLDYPNSSELRQAGMTVHDSFMKVSARALRQPVLEAGDSDFIKWDGQDRDVKSQMGSWSMQTRKVWQRGYIYKVIFISMADRFSIANDKRNQGLLVDLAKVWRDMGVRFQQAPDSFHDYQGSDAVAYMDGIMNLEMSQHDKDADYNRKMGGYLVVVVVNMSDKQKRESVKWWGDVSTGFVTQILRQDKLTNFKGFDQYARNVGLKINAKMGGINVIPSPSIVSRIGEPVAMIIGIDTSHPPPGSQSPTTAAMVYSVDKENYVDYRAVVRFQPPRQELVEDLRQMMRFALEDFVNTTKNIPQLIMVYRDGVSEGQFRQVLDTEVKSIRAAIDDCWEDYNVGDDDSKPKLIFTVVGKKHHIRFFPEPNGMMADRKGNAIPGTVIDDEITTADPQVFDYYLQSHGAILGTSRPAHYSVLVDEPRLSKDQHEAIAFDLCHVYQIATRSVSTPAPVYYADKVAGRFDIQWYQIKDTFDNLSQLSTDSIEYEAYKQHFDTVGVKKQTQRRMYWL